MRAIGKRYASSVMTPRLLGRTAAGGKKITPTGDWLKLFIISLEVVIEVFTSSCEDNDDGFVFFFKDGIGKFIVCFVVENII
jgi:hypothetical protein